MRDAALPDGRHFPEPRGVGEHHAPLPQDPAGCDQTRVPGHQTQQGQIHRRTRKRPPFR